MGQNGAGADRAPRVGRPLPKRRAAPGRQHGCPGGDRPGVRDHPAAPAAVAPQGDGRGLLEHLDPRLGGHQLRQATGDRAARLGAAGVHDPARRMAALQGQAPGRPPARCRSAPPLAKLLHRRRRLPSQHLDRPGAAQPATGVQGVVGVAGRRIVRRQRRREPALRPVAGALGERLARDERAPPRPARRRAAPRTGRPHRPDHRDVRLGRSRSTRRLPYSPTDGALPRASVLARARHRAPPRERRRGCGRSRRRSTSAGWPDWSGSRRRRRRSSSSSEFIPDEHIDAVEAICSRRRRHDRRRHGREPSAPSRRRFTPRGARRRRPSGCSPARTGFAFCGLRPPGHHAEGRPRDGLLPVQQRRGGRRARARRVRRRTGADPRLGRPPRERDGGDLRRLRSRAVREHPPVAALSRAPARRTSRGAARGRGTR